MFITAKKEETNDLASFAWRRQSDIKTASYPIDRYKSEDNFKRIIARYVNGNPAFPDDTVLVYRENGHILAVVILDVECGNRYIKANGLYATGNVRHIITELREWCSQKYEGYNLHMGFPPENKAAIKAALLIGAEIEENSDFYRLDPEDFKPFSSNPDIRLLKKEDLDEFSLFYDRYFPPESLYWNSERIREQFGIWRIYALYADGQMKSCVNFIGGEGYTNIGEVFGITAAPEISSPEVYCELLTKGISAEFADGKIYIILPIEAKEELVREAALQIGFKKIGGYIGLVFRV